MQADNLHFLAEALGLPGLEVLNAQQPVGPFYADMVCRVIGTDHVVLIENQLDQADHRHLGQVLTYAPHVDAKTCVWVAERIRDEHRAAVDWLNRITAEGYSFFGVEVQAFRIGNSIPAPLFNVVAKPNEFSRIAGAAVETTTSTGNGRNVEYWKGLHQKLAETGGPLRKIGTDLRDVTYWAPIAGNGRAYIWAFRSLSRNPYVTAGVSLYNSGAAEIGERLFHQRDHVEAAIGEPLKWFANKQRTAYHIQFASRSSSLDETDWQDQYDWLIGRMRLLNQVLTPTILQEIEEYDRNAAE
jgi:hypothetical protein